jgi:hypothetical protein
MSEAGKIIIKYSLESIDFTLYASRYNDKEVPFMDRVNLSGLDQSQIYILYVMIQDNYHSKEISRTFPFLKMIARYPTAHR